MLVHIQMQQMVHELATPHYFSAHTNAMQHLIMLVHIQMQQMVHELAPPICVLKF